MRSAILVIHAPVLLGLLSFLPVAHGFGNGGRPTTPHRRRRHIIRSHRHRYRRPQLLLLSSANNSRHSCSILSTATLPVDAFHLTTRLCAATASAGESEATGSSSESPKLTSSSSLPSALPSLKIMQANQKYFDDDRNGDDDDIDEDDEIDMAYKEWSVMVKKSVDDDADDMEKSTSIDDYSNSNNISIKDENEWDEETAGEETVHKNDISIETSETTDADDIPISNIIVASDNDNVDDNGADDESEIDNAQLLPYWNDNITDDEDDMDDIANMLMEYPPTLRQEVVRKQLEISNGEETKQQQIIDGERVLVPRPPPIPPLALSQNEGVRDNMNDDSSRALLDEKEEISINEDGIESEAKVEAERDEVELPPLKGDYDGNDDSVSSMNNIIVATESSQASLSRTYSIDEAYKIFKGGDSTVNIVFNDDVVGTGGVINENDTDDSPNNDYDKQLLVEANELIASLKDRQMSMERELDNGKIQLDEALEAKARAMTEVDELIASLENQEGIMERELNDGKAKLEEALEGKARAAAEYGFAVNKYIDLKDSMAILVANQTNAFINNQTSTATIMVQEEKARGKANLQRLSDEYEGLLSKKSRKIFELRQALRSANDRKRRLERQVRLGSKENESELRMGKEERERLMAEITLLTKSFGDVQAELATNAKMYNDCIESYEKEAAMKDERIRGLEEDLRMANEHIHQLESQIAELTSELEKARIISANLTSVVSELQNELSVARTNANGYDDIISILRRESETYQSELANALNDTQLYKEKTSNLEELLSKTKDSLVSEKKRVVDALTAKDNQIAQLDRDLADKCNEIRASEATIETTTKELNQMTNMYNTEKDRADALDRKIERLNQLTAANAVAATEKNTSTTAVGSSEEADRLATLMEEISKSNDEYKSLVSTYDDKVKFLSRQLLLSGQNLSNKQSQIECLRRDLVATTSKARVVSENKSSASEEVTNLRAKLEDVQSKSTMWKAQANGMIIQLTNDLREKDASMLELQSKLDKLSEGKPENGQQQEQQSSTINGGTQDDEIAQLRYAMEEAQLKAKERIKQKNQSLKEMEDIVTTLTSEMEDLRREKDKLNDRLVEENERSKHDYEIHERQLRQTEDRLSKDHLTAMTEIENEMNQTVRQLEMEIETLKRNSAMGTTASSQGTAAVKSTLNDLKIQEMEEALRRSKDMEVSLINQNMQMKNKIQDLQQQVEERSNVAGMLLNDDEDDDSDEMSDNPLPTYYRERQRPQVIQFVGNAWKRLFRRKQLM